MVRGMIKEEKPQEKKADSPIDTIPSGIAKVPINSSQLQKA